MLFLLFLIARGEEEIGFDEDANAFIEIIDIIYKLGKFKLSEDDKNTYLSYLKTYAPSAPLSNVIEGFDSKTSQMINSFIQSLQTGVDTGDLVDALDKMGVIDIINNIWVAGDFKKFLKKLQKKGILKALPELGFQVDTLEDIIYVLEELNIEKPKIKFNYFIKMFKRYAGYDVEPLYDIAKKVIEKGELNFGIVSDEIVDEIKKISEIPSYLVSSIVTVLDSFMKPFYKMLQQDKENLAMNVKKLIFVIQNLPVDEEYEDFKTLIIGILKNIIDDGKQELGIFKKSIQDIIDFLSSVVKQGGIRELILSYTKGTKQEDLVSRILNMIDNKKMEFDTQLLTMITETLDECMINMTNEMIQLIQNKKPYKYLSKIISSDYAYDQNWYKNSIDKVYDLLINKYKELGYEYTHNSNELIGSLKIIVNGMKKVIPALEPLLGPFYKIFPPIIDLSNNLVTLISEKSNYKTIICKLFAHGEEMFEFIDALLKYSDDVTHFQCGFLNLYNFIKNYVENFQFDQNEGTSSDKYYNAIYKFCRALEKTKAYEAFPVINRVQKIFSLLPAQKPPDSTPSENTKRSVLGSTDVISFEYVLKTFSDAGDILTVNILNKVTELFDEVSDCASSKGDARSFSKELLNNDILEIVGNTAKIANGIQNGDLTYEEIQQTSKNIETGIENSRNNDLFSDGGLSSGAIAGIVIACIVVVIAIVCVSIFFMKKNKEAKTSDSENIKA